MQHSLNDFRKVHDKPIVFVWNGIQSLYCKEHCWSMAREDRVYHTPEHLLKDWKEIVLGCTYCGEHIHDLARKIMFEVIESNLIYKSIVLESEDLAYGYVIHDSKFFLTIRGK